MVSNADVEKEWMVKDSRAMRPPQRLKQKRARSGVRKVNMQRAMVCETVNGCGKIELASDVQLVSESKRRTFPALSKSGRNDPMSGFADWVPYKCRYREVTTLE